MWSQPPPPVADWWVLHVAASPHEVDDVLTELCIHHRARPLANPEYPAYLAGRCGPGEPPAWMSVAKTELDGRGVGAHWCEAGCGRHPAASDRRLADA